MEHGFYSSYTMVQWGPGGGGLEGGVGGAGGGGEFFADKECSSGISLFLALDNGCMITQVGHAK